ISTQDLVRRSRRIRAKKNFPVCDEVIGVPLSDLTYWSALGFLNPLLELLQFFGPGISLIFLAPIAVQLCYPFMELILKLFDMGIDSGISLCEVLIRLQQKRLGLGVFFLCQQRGAQFDLNRRLEKCSLLQAAASL